MIPITDNLSCKGRPIVTFILIALNMLGFFIELSVPSGQLDAFLMQWALVPSQFMHALVSGNIFAVSMALMTMVTASFLHGGWMHILGNMLFLQAFGRAVEARMGHLGYAAFYMLACFAAWGMFLFSDPSSGITALGASGAIAGVLGAYLVFFPASQFRIVMMVKIVPVPLTVMAWIFLAVWMGMQLTDGIGAIVNPATTDSVAYWAHIGGFLFGMIAAGALDFFRPDNSVCYVPLNCECDCKGTCQHKIKHRFSLIRFWKLDFWSGKPDKCDLDGKPRDNDEDKKQ